MSQGDTIETERVFGLPFRSTLELRGFRFLDAGGDGSGAGDGDDEGDSDDEQGSDAGDDADEQSSDGDDSDDEGFDGDFDAKRARRTIDRLRREAKAAKAAAAAASEKGGPDTAAIQAENLRLKVALKTGLDADLADRLKGSTEDELLEDAQKLLDRFYPDEKKLPTRQPKPRLRGGSDPDDEPELTADDIVSKALSR